MPAVSTSSLAPWACESCSSGHSGRVAYLRLTLTTLVSLLLPTSNAIVPFYMYIIYMSAVFKLRRVSRDWYGCG